MRSKTYDRLSDFDRRLADLPGRVYQFSDIKSWEKFWKTCNSPSVLTCKGKLVVICFDANSHEQN